MTASNNTPATQRKRKYVAAGKGIYATITHKILENAEGPLNYREITKRALAELMSYWAKEKLTEPKDIPAALRRSISSDELFVGLGEGMYDLRIRHPNKLKPKPKPRPKKADVKGRKEPEKEEEVVARPQTQAEVLGILQSVMNMLSKGVITAPIVYENGSEILIGWINDKKKAINQRLLNSTKGMSEAAIDQIIATATQKLEESIPKAPEPVVEAVEEPVVEEEPEPVVEPSVEFGNNAFADAVTNLILDLINSYALGKCGFPTLYLDDSGEVCISYHDSPNPDVDTGIKDDKAEFWKAGDIIETANIQLTRECAEADRLIKQMKIDEMAVLKAVAVKLNADIEQVVEARLAGCDWDKITVADLEREKTDTAPELVGLLTDGVYAVTYIDADSAIKTVNATLDRQGAVGEPPASSADEIAVWAPEEVDWIVFNPANILRMQPVAVE